MGGAYGMDERKEEYVQGWLESLKEEVDWLED